jgi:type II secretory ATPase GspE/PulE/Tfp pilus assembly ATPase PilB-like protein
MIGEIRDLETVQIAVQAALTGHLVLSTVHTNSAAATLTRLRDMGLEDYLMTATLRAVLAQRLVRRLCPACKTAEPDPAALIQRLGLERLADGREITIYRPAGCPECRDTGYRGRRAIAELLIPSRATDRLIFEGAGDAVVGRVDLSRFRWVRRMNSLGNHFRLGERWARCGSDKFTVGAGAGRRRHGGLPDACRERCGGNATEFRVLTGRTGNLPGIGS